MSDYKLVAPHIDYLTRWIDRRLPNPTKPSPALCQVLDRFFTIVKDLAPVRKNEEVKTLWISVPRGEPEDWESFEEMKDWGDVKSYDEYEKQWKAWYPEETCWYEVGLAENLNQDGSLRYRGVFLNNNCIVSAMINGYYNSLEEDACEDTETTLLELIMPALAESMGKLRAGTYNEYVQKSLTVYERVGVIRRSDLWEAYPERKRGIWGSLTEETFQTFREYAQANEEKDIAPMLSMTANTFFHACALGYQACGYDTEGMTDEELYLRYADGRDEGLTGTGHGLNAGPGIDRDSQEAWNAWYRNPSRGGGHPWEVCRGGSFTHVSLYVHDKKRVLDFERRAGYITQDDYDSRIKDAGYYFEVSGSAWTRAVEAVNFFVAIRKAGYPVLLSDGDAILARFLGEDYIGIVPHRLFPDRQEELYPDSYGTILDFLHIEEEELEKMGDKITWLPEEPAELKKEKK